jgi:hypothetical protein
MMQTEIEIYRELASETVKQLADARRKRKAAEAERDLATADIRMLLDETAAPFGVAALVSTEDELLAMAVETLVDFDAARRAELVAGRECAKLECPDGVRVDWRERASVPDANQLPLLFQKVAPKTKEILAALKKGTAVKGASLVVTPVVVVGGDEAPAESETP